MKTLGLMIMGLAIVLFYLIFFKLAPFVGNQLPTTDWTPFLKIIIYVGIGWLGGVAIPIVLLICGFGLIVEGLK